MHVVDCIGCGYCCRKAPCYLGEITKNGKWCDFLYYSRKKKMWRCRLMRKNKEVRTALAAGCGCCSAMNTLRRTGTVPTPEQLKEGKYK